MAILEKTTINKKNVTWKDKQKNIFNENNKITRTFKLFKIPLLKVTGKLIVNHKLEEINKQSGLGYKRK